MSWGLGWKRPSEIFHLTLSYGNDDPPESLARTSTSSRSSSASSSSSSSSASSIVSQDQDLGFRIELDWSSSEDEDQVALKLQSQLMVALPMPQDTVVIELTPREEDEDAVDLVMKVVKRRDPLRAITMAKAVNSGQQTDGTGVLTRLLRSDLVSTAPEVVDAGVPGSGGGHHWTSLAVLSICGCGLSVFPVELTQLPHIEKLYLNNNKLAVLPPELGELRSLRVLRVDNNMLVSVPVELRQCVELVELSLEHNKLVRPLLDFRAMAELRVLRLFGNPLEFLPEILPLHKLRHLSLANIRIVADENLRSVNVQIEVENNSYFGASRHKLSAAFSLIFRFSSCHHPLLASALGKIMQDQGNREFVGKDENAVRQLISMISSDNCHVVEQACSALSALASDDSVALQLMKADIMQPIGIVLKSAGREEVISVLQVVVQLAFTSDIVAVKMLTKDVLKSLKILCAYKDPEVQRLALLAVGNLAFCLENRRILVTSESLRELLLRMAVATEPRVYKAAARALAILGENENLRRAVRGRQMAKQGLRILSMDGGGMKGLATVQMLKEIEKGTGKRIHELFDLICGTSTGGMLAVSLGMKLMTLEECEDIYKNLGKHVFAEPVPKDNEAATWRDKLDQLYKSSSQSFRVVVHGSKHSADQFERLLKEMCTDEDGDLLIDSAVKNVPKVFVVSTLVSMMPAQPFIFRNYQYPAGTPEVALTASDSAGIAVLTSPMNAQVGYKRSAFIGSCKHQVWQAIRASSAAPYYLDDFSDDVNRWQDGAIVANNPTIFAIREAQLLWPDTKIDCLVSIGCGSVPTKIRKGGWRYMDTGQVLVESACSVDRVEEALSTLLPMLPEMHYFRFNPVDEHCDMELDETDPTIWLKLESAVEEYIQQNHLAFENACERLLLPFQHEERWSENLKTKLPKTKESIEGANGPTLGWRRNVLLVEASHNPDSGRSIHHARALESFCARNGIRLSLMQGLSGTVKTVPSSTFPTPFASPLFTGSFPSSPLFNSPDIGHRIGRIDLVPPLSLDGQQGKAVASPPLSPRGLRQLSLPVKTLHEKLLNSPQVGVIHLALQADSDGLIISWHNDVFVVAEPGELAEKFLQNVKFSLLSTMRSHRIKGASLLANISTISDLVAFKPYFQIGGIVHRYLGRQTLVMEDNQEIGSYMFRRTVPSMQLSADDVRWMVGAWRDRIIICTGTYGPTLALLKAFLDSGAKAVICPSNEPPEPQLTTLDGTNELNVMENGKFEIGEDEADDENIPASPVSDWEDSDAEKNADCTSFWDDDEEELSQFICQLYESLFREGAGVNVALQHALATYRRVGYVCHLPGVQ
ncbi:putative phospholipase A(1) [Medicago truncatula]|uniref:Patatin n=1 Tax=Medicago truncatula TaxID=3880 RepID=A0A396IPW9_MEDTR|nr:phospholipase A I [Medicago truncatula]RHN64947.1 putative phospholipase A(1) [Medicago truncatula]